MPFTLRIFIDYFSYQVELKIHETADRQVEALRVRERQLVRQVEVSFPLFMATV